MKFDTNQTDATLLWVVNSRCNLSCPFCSNLEIHSKKEHSKQFSSIKNKLLLNYKRILKLPDLGLGGLKIVIEERIRNKFFPQLPERIRIPDLIRTLDNSGKKFLINFTGGEPLLVSNIIEACQELTLHGHRIILNTNLTTGDIEGFCKKVPIESVVCIYASGHLRDIRNKKLMSLYLDNLQLCQKKGFNIIINEVAYPAYKRDVAIYVRHQPFLDTISFYNMRL